MEKLILLGATGMLGSELLPLLQEHYDVTPLSSKDIDLSDVDSVQSTLDQYKGASWLVNCAAYTAVDQAEEQEELATKINGYAVGEMAKWCKTNACRIVTFSTDYVLPGTAPEGYMENDETGASTAYGRSKELGEKLCKENQSKHLIIRTSWLYGSHGRDFIDAIMDRAKSTGKLTIVDDQHGCPTYALDVARHTVKLMDELPGYGVFHFCNAGRTTWYDFACHIFKELTSLENPKEEYTYPEITAVSSDEFPTKAKRPHYSVMHNTKFTILRAWDYALHEYIKNNY